RGPGGAGRVRYPQGGGVDAGLPGKLPTPPWCPMLRVLVVDDLLDSTESLALPLRLWGHESQTATGGLSALAASDFRPDVALRPVPADAAGRQRDYMPCP